MSNDNSDTESNMAEVEEQAYEEVDDGEEYEVEKLLDHRPSNQRENTIDYFIKWKNYDSSWNTWENEQNIFSVELIEYYWSQQSVTREEVLRNARGKKRGRAKEDAREKAKKKTSKENETSEGAKQKLLSQETDNQALHISTTDLPPDGMTWEKDAVEVVHVYANNDNVLYGEVKWSNNTTTFCPTLRLREICPVLLLKFYESHLFFSSQPS
ncbi:hypothetical protein EC973_004159 [Apophysomyces ossiformis]|uniref:Chromo domain-containing protein n=1 Tax=Apophysomyces ossiformis TaxID=679940 RepID=A0A8H7EKQ0_9FUNG|nr:hypothetical protein EC973_004159 [Apophysomyces ossiformis]